ncbi:MAG: glycosyltransferase, partial [Caldisphaera sp.]
RKKRLTLIAVVGQILDRENPRSMLHILDLEKLLPDYEIVHIGGVKSTVFLSEYLDLLEKNRSSIKFYENLNENEKIEILSSSKYLIRFGKNEYGPGMPVIEAISSGVPLIMNVGIGSSEMIKEFKAGYVLEKVNAQAIANLIIHTDDVEYASLVTNTLILRDSWSWKDHAEALLKLSENEFSKKQE